MRLSAAVLALGIPWVVTVAPLITGIVLYTLGLSRLQLVAHATLCILCSFFIVLLQVGPLRLILLVRHLVLCALQGLQLSSSSILAGCCLVAFDLRTVVLELLCEPMLTA